MQKINSSILKYKNPTTEKFEGFPLVVGKSAYDIAKEQGFEGTEEEWVDSLKVETNESFIVLQETVNENNAKLDTVEEYANNYNHPTYTAKSSGLYKVTVDATGHVSGTAAVAKSDITALGIPAQDTVYTHPTSHPVSMITGLATVATSGSYNDLSNKPIIPAAYSLPTASSSTLGGVKTTSTVTSTSGLTACPIISGVPYYKDTNNTYSLSSFGITATAAELNYCDGVTSNIQTQINTINSTLGDISTALTSILGV